MWRRLGYVKCVGLSGEAFRRGKSVGGVFGVKMLWYEWR